MACADFFKPRQHRRHNVHNPSVRRVFSQSNYLFNSKKLQDLGLTARLWKTYRTSALYNFSFSADKINKYKQRLENFIKEELSGGEHEKLQSVSVSITPLFSTVFLEGEQPGLKICIKGENEDGKTLCFTGFLLSLHRKPGFMERARKEAQAVVLPLFLVDCTENDDILFTGVSLFLQRNFQTHVSPLKFSSRDLMWMLALSSCAEKKSGTVVLEYNLPLEEISTIQFAINSVHEACQAIFKPSNDELTEAQVQAFYSEFLKHSQNLVSMNLAGLELSVIKTHILRLDSDHSVYIFENKYLFPVLRHLTHLAQEMR